MLNFEQGEAAQRCGWNYLSPSEHQWDQCWFSTCWRIRALRWRGFWELEGVKELLEEYSNLCFESGYLWLFIQCMSVAARCLKFAKDTFWSHWLVLPLFPIPASYGAPLRDCEEHASTHEYSRSRALRHIQGPSHGPANPWSRWECQGEVDVHFFFFFRRALCRPVAHGKVPQNK